jgi:acyl carrier protein
MTTDEIRDRLAHIIVERVNSGVAIEEIGWNSKLRDDLGIDSLAAAELLFEIDQEFGAPIGTIDARSLVTVRDAVNAISRGLPSSRAA